MKSARLLSAITSATEAFIDEATTVTVETSASPIISAVAVFAVRRGLRSALRRASCAVVPPSRASGAPISRVTTVAMGGARVSTPARVSSIATAAGGQHPPARGEPDPPLLDHRGRQPGGAEHGEQRARRDPGTADGPGRG